ncbi:MAG TPA: NAD(P) transhydrogenase subunit alpha [Pyrinomonadaceae bacterium]|jgi:NAD(P) transhydrogenase subunit alpha
MILMILISSETSTSFTAETLIPALYVFALAAFLGYQVISRVPPLLHTPLMSATNAISGISLVGSIVTAGAQYNKVSTILGFTAVTCATINVVGGFMITDRMLRMFKRKPTAKETKELAEKEKRQIASGNGDGTKQ